MPRLQDNESTRQLVGRQPDGLRRTTRQRVNETTSGAAATCGLVVCEAKAVAGSKPIAHYSKPNCRKNHHCNTVYYKQKVDKTGQNRTKQDKTGQNGKVIFRIFVSLQNQTEKCDLGNTLNENVFASTSSLLQPRKTLRTTKSPIPYRQTGEFFEIVWK